MFKVGHLFCCVLIVHACSPGVDVVSGENQEDLVRRSVGNFPPPPPPPPPGGKNGERGGSSGNPGRGTVTSPALSGGKNDGLVGSSGDPESGAITNPVPLLPPPGGNSGGKSDGLVGSSGDPRGEAVTNPVPPLPPPGGNSGGKSDGRVGSSGHPRGGTVTSLVLSGESDGSGGRTEASSPADEARGATESIVDKEKEEKDRKSAEKSKQEEKKVRKEKIEKFKAVVQACHNQLPETLRKSCKPASCYIQKEVIKLAECGTWGALVDLDGGEFEKRVQEFQKEMQRVYEVRHQAEAWKTILEKDKKALDKEYEEMPQKSGGAKKYMFNTSAIKQVEKFLIDQNKRIAKAWKFGLMLDWGNDVADGGPCQLDDLKTAEAHYEQIKKIRKALQEIVKNIDAATEASETVGNEFLSSQNIDTLKRDVERLIAMDKSTDLDPKVWGDDIVNTEDSHEQWEKQEQCYNDLKQSVGKRASLGWEEYWDKYDVTKKQKFENSLSNMVKALSIDLKENLLDLTGCKGLSLYGEPCFNAFWQILLKSIEKLDWYKEDNADLLKGVLKWFGRGIVEEENNESCGWLSMDSYIRSTTGGCVEFNAISQSLEKFRTSTWALLMKGEPALLGSKLVENVELL